MRTEDITTATLSIFGLSITLSDFRNWLDIILIILSIINISIILIIKIRRYLKDGKLDNDEVKDISNDLENIRKTIKKINKDGDNNEQSE